MCPVCLATAAIIAGSATGTGGLTALVARRAFGSAKPKDQFPTTAKRRITMATSLTEVHPHKTVSHAEWIEARKQFLAKEKEFTRLRDELSRQRRELPWERVEKPYVFEGPRGKEDASPTFSIIAASSSSTTSCSARAGAKAVPSCSYLADHFDGMTIHLAHRDVTFAVVSRAPYAQIAAYKKRMGWRFHWVSSFGSDFNYDYHVSQTEEEKASGKADYNYPTRVSRRRAPGRQRVLQGRERRDLPHLLDLRARAGHSRRHLQLPRPGAQGPRRGRPEALHGVGAASRQVRRRLLRRCGEGIRAAEDGRAGRRAFVLLGRAHQG